MIMADAHKVNSPTIEIQTDTYHHEAYQEADQSHRFTTDVDDRGSNNHGWHGKKYNSNNKNFGVRVLFGE